ncbi:MAG: hypothetical protein ACKVS9_12995 [Phycisphaerae bacterium]
MLRRTLGLVGSSLIATVALADPSVTVSVGSSQDGAAVVAGTPIDWSISFTVSTGDNEGLSLLSVDFAQALANPALFDIPSGTGIPAGMTNFARPLGVSNPGVGGYRGTQIGTAGQRNLVQIGGGQNTFGTALNPGAGVAESANVIAGVGQSGPQLLATGTFNAPGPCGTYTFSISNALATVLTDRNDAPAVSTVLRITPTISDASFSLLVTLAGDLDGDRDVDLSDLSRLLANFGVSGGATRAQGDINGDGDVDLSDLSGLLAQFGANC